MKFSATSKKYNKIKLCDRQCKMKFITVYSLSEYLQKNGGNNICEHLFTKYWSDFM